MKPRPTRIRLRTWRLAAALISIIPCSAEDFFDLLEATPAEVAHVFPSVPTDLNRAGWAATPIDDHHKKEWESALAKIAARRTNAGGGEAALLDFLENESRLDEALAFAESERNKGRTLALRIRNGEGVDPATRYDPSGHGQYQDSWAALGQLDLARGRQEEADRLYAALEFSPSLSPELNAMFILRRLELPMRRESMETFLADDSRPILHLARNSMMGRRDLVSRKLEDPAFKPAARDLALLLYAYGNEKVLVDRIPAALAAAETSDTDREALLRTVMDGAMRFNLWAGMPSGHGASAGIVSGFTYRPDRARQEELLPILTPIIQRAGDSPELDSMMAWIYRTPEDLPQLWRIAGKFRAWPGSPPFPADPALAAIHRLATSASPEELDRLLSESASFQALPPLDRLRYFIAARLDLRVVEILPECPFENPAMDRISDDLPSYFRDENMLIPPALRDIILREIPRIVMGSPGKAADAIVEEGSEWAEFIEARLTEPEEKARLINRLAAAVEQRDPAIKTALAGRLPAAVWTYPGLNVEKPAGERRDRLPPIPAWMDYIRLFSNPVPTPYPDLYGTARQRENNSSLFGGLLNLSPYRPAIPTRNGINRLDAAKAARMRDMLDDIPARTLIYDLLVSEGLLACPDPEMKRKAEARFTTPESVLTMDPFIRAVIVLRQLAKGEDDATAVSFLGDVETIPQPIRDRLAQAAAGITTPDPGHAARLRTALGTAVSPGPPQAATPPAHFREADLGNARIPGQRAPNERTVSARELEAGNQLRTMIASGKAGTPEAARLAEELVVWFCKSGKESPRDDEQLAIGLLTRAGKFDDAAAKAGTRMKEGGTAEVDVLRARLQLYRARTPVAAEEITRIASQIIELEPTDIRAARSLLPSAVAAGGSRHCIAVAVRAEVSPPGRVHEFPHRPPPRFR